MKQKIKENKEKKAYKSQLARAAACQNSYFSRVLKADAHLTPDQGAALCHFWQLDERETDYFLLLLNLERAHTPQLRRILRQKLEKLNRKGNVRASQLKLEGDSLEPQRAMRYYSAWYWSAIRAALAIPSLRTESALATHLALPVGIVNDVLQGLVDMKLAVQVGDEWQRSGQKEIHIHEHPVLVSMQNASLRQKAIVMEQMGTEDRHFNFSSIYAISRKDRQRIEKLLTDATQQYIEIVRASTQAEELVGFSCDFFVF